MCEENLNDVKNEEIAEKTRSANPFWPFIPAGITWFIGLLFLQGIDHIFMWWTLTCGWFPLYYAMKQKYPTARKKWNIANGFAVTFLLILPGIFCLLYVLMAPFI